LRNPNIRWYEVSGAGHYVHDQPESVALCR
jgi:hypothetical protein